MSGSTIVTLKVDYLKTLSVGTHKLTVVYNDGECSTNFEVKKSADSQSPKTGDNSHMALWIALHFDGGCLLTVTGVYSKKKKHSEN